MTITKMPNLTPIENVWTETKNVCPSKKADKNDQVTPDLSGGMGKNSHSIVSGL